MSGGATVVEAPVAGWEVPALTHPGWAERFPWLVQGITTRGSEAAPFDLALFGDASGHRVHDRWSRLRDATACPRAVHGRQVHARRVALHPAGPPGLLLLPGLDGHVTRARGLLLTVSVADCVPVSVVDGRLRAVALLHAGWRGAAAGILERGLTVLQERLGSGTGDVHLHLGPSICGACYEVGPEVHEALGLDVPAGPTPVDLRAALARRAERAGVPSDRITVSRWCTLCGGEGGEDVLFSHRGGDRERQMAFLGIREASRSVDSSGPAPEAAEEGGGSGDG